MKQKVRFYLKKWLVIASLGAVAYLVGFALAQHEVAMQKTIELKPTDQEEAN